MPFECNHCVKLRITSEAAGQPAPLYVTCRCQHCGNGIEFDSNGLAKGEVRRVECPHCRRETILSLLGPETSSVISHVDFRARPTGQIEAGVLQESLRQEPKAGVSSLHQSPALGHAHAVRIAEELQSRVEAGHPVERNMPAKPGDRREEASDVLLERALAGDSEAQYLLGLASLKGEGVRQDVLEGFKWIRWAAEGGHARAQFGLAEVYHAKGDIAEALKWYYPAAEQGNAEAQFALGIIYGCGQSVPKDSAQAAKWYRAAAVQGHPAAQNNLGIAYDQGEGVPQHSGEAVNWYRMAAENGNADAQYNLGLACYRGEGMPEDRGEAAQWFRQAAEQGLAKAQFLVGIAFWLGDGTAKDTAEAVKWFRQAAEQGYSRAQFQLGYALDTGEGIGKDCLAAIKWYQAAAEQGHADAQFNVARACFLGEGVPQDYVQAYKWINLACTQGSERARELRDVMVQHMTPSQIEEGQRLTSIEAPKVEKV